VSIIGGLDLHRAQITYDWIDTDTGQTRQGQLAPASREHLRTQVRLYKALVDQRTAWQQRIHAGCSATACRPSPICWSPSAASA